QPVYHALSTPCNDISSLYVENLLFVNNPNNVKRFKEIFPLNFF
ncbi:hypothetical protein Q604_UNBC13422G0001, partial [human gut metagenome]